MKPVVEKKLALSSLISQQGIMGFAGLALGALGLTASVFLLAVSGWFLTAAGVAGLCLSTLHTFNYLQPAALIRLLAITRTLALYGERIVSHDGILRLLARLRLWLFDALARKDRFRLTRLGSGELMQRMLADIDLLDQWPLRGLAPWIWSIFLGLLFLLVLFFFSFPLALIFSGVLVLILGVLPFVFSSPALALSRMQTRKAGERRQFLLETLAGLITLRTTGGFGERLEKFWHLDGEFFHNQWRLQGLGILAQLLIFLFLSAGLWMMVLYGGRAVQEGLFSSALLVGFSCVLLGLQEVLASLSQTFQAQGFTHSARTRLREAAQEDGENRGRITALPGDPRLCLESVSARFDGALSGPDGVSFSLHKGESLWVEGASGCGKSTLAAVMGGWLRPFSGKVFVNGIPMEEVEEKVLRRHVGFLDQTIHLFPLSLGENLRLASPQASDETLWEVLEAVLLADWAKTLPQGLHTLLGEYGAGLSGGQARRLALARLLLMKTPILILDEPFEGLDGPTAEALLAMLRERQAEGILILISHQALGGGFTRKYGF
jgi:ATP-binding cassette subfamily C protein CydC